MPISRFVAVSLRPASSVRRRTFASTGRVLRLETARDTTDRPRARFSCMTESFTCGVSRGLPERMGVDRSVVRDPGDPTRTRSAGRLSTGWSGWSLSSHSVITVILPWMWWTVTRRRAASGCWPPAWSCGPARRFRGWAGARTWMDRPWRANPSTTGSARCPDPNDPVPRIRRSRPRLRPRCPPVRLGSSTAGCDRRPGRAMPCPAFPERARHLEVLRSRRHTPIMDMTAEGATMTGNGSFTRDPGRTSRA